MKLAYRGCTSAMRTYLLKMLHFRGKKDQMERQRKMTGFVVTKRQELITALMINVGLMMTLRLIDFDWLH